MKQCNRKKCKELKPLSEFNKDKNRKDGYSNRCRECTKLLQRKNYYENKDVYYKRKLERIYKRRVFIIKDKLKKGCKECGVKHPAILEYHHKDPSKKNMEIAVNYKFTSMYNLLKEIAKCDVLCSNCHRTLHWDIKNGDNFRDWREW